MRRYPLWLLLLILAFGALAWLAVDELIGGDATLILAIAGLSGTCALFCKISTGHWLPTRRYPP